MYEYNTPLNSDQCIAKPMKTTDNMEKIKRVDKVLSDMM